MIRKWFFRFFFLGLAGGLGALITIVGAHLSVKSSAENRVFASADDVPKRKAAVVMGCAQVLAGGRTNLYFSHRINAAVALFESGKCEYLIVSGDNSVEEYDEPTDMRDALIARGIPENRIYRDYAGFRTLDSVVRAKEIFGQEELIVVSQEFHNERAIYLADHHGIDAVGLNATAVNRMAGIRTKLREYLARVKTILDVKVLGTEPKFLGKPVELGGPVT